MAQETGTVGWDVTTDSGGLDLTWSVLLAFLAFGLVCYVLWRLMLWFAGKNTDAVGWRTKRYWWPTAMVACGWLSVAVERAGLPGAVRDSVLGTLVILNLPALLVAKFLSQHLRWLPAWLLALFLSAIGWLVWYAIVRFLEWRVRERQPVSLHLTSGPAG
jgi:hypothetical protein